ncbi:MAG: aminopeptidase [Eubacterium sp.]|nr:aminopeptidase [Eubacterium sp.]
MSDEKFDLFMGRIREIPEEKTVPEPFRDFFVREARYIQAVLAEAEKMKASDLSFEELQAGNLLVYEDILPENYGASFGNPAYACHVLGKEYGKYLGFLYTEIQGLYAFALEDRMFDICAVLELFLQMYGAFEDAELPGCGYLKEMVYYYNYDYCREFLADRVAETVDPSLDFAVRIIDNSDLTDLRYLYKYGEYISENEMKTAEFLNSLPEEEIEAMARTFTEGYRIGFEVTGKDISIKKTVNIRYRIGFERMVKAAIRQFGEIGLSPVIYRTAQHRLNKKSADVGYFGGKPNRQYDYDHRNDEALYLDEKFVTRKLSAYREGFEEQKANAKLHGGPAVIDVFGEAPFSPAACPDACAYTPAQQELKLRLDTETGQITNRYIIGSERSFTIIAFPGPEIGENFEEIFKETVRINTLDYMTYRNIQQILIDALDKGKAVRIKGCGKNETDLTVQLYRLSDPARETIFENCVADVNIPVGEVFTTPVLKGTEGLLHLPGVFLEGLQFTDLRLTVKDGMIADYSCANFDSEEENRKYIEENILFRHPTVPMGEFAIGTNTTAYEVGRRYHIEGILPILIAEKTGPHFAFGDTCYSWDEDNMTYNPDGKAIVARDNDWSILRKTDISKAYFNCHTDITIPYDELAYIKVIGEDGSETALIENGRFVLPGCEELNGPLERA